MINLKSFIWENLQATNSFNDLTSEAKGLLLIDVQLTKYDFVSCVCRQDENFFAQCVTLAKCDGEWYHLYDKKVSKKEKNDVTLINIIENFGILHLYQLIESTRIKENQEE